MPVHSMSTAENVDKWGQQLFFLSKVAIGHTDNSNSTKILMPNSVKNAIVPIKIEGSFQWKKRTDWV